VEVVVSGPVLRRLVMGIVLVTAGLTLGLATPAQATPAKATPSAPAGLCPKHPAQYVNKTVHLAAAGHDALLCANLSGATLDGLDLTQMDLSYANLSSASLQHANLTQADLTGAQLTNAHFDDADLTQATMKNVSADFASFANAHLGQATITDATMTHTDLTGADLGQADLSNSDFTGATVDGADFTQATLTGTKIDRTSGIATDLGSSTGLSPHVAGWIGAVVCIALAGFVIMIIVAISRASRRAAALRAQQFVHPGNPAAGTPGPAGYIPTQPGAFATYPTAQTPAGVPTTLVPPVMQGDAATPYLPTVPDIQPWQPMTTSASMAEAANVVEEVKEKRWFGKR
jgi:hypothetical protein